MKKLLVILCAIMLVSSASIASAAPLKVFVADVNAIGVQNKDEIKVMLQTLLASRLNSDSITSVASASEADAVVSGTYMVIGKVFSLDALVKTTGGKTLTRSFIQGENQEELIPSVSKLAEKLTKDISRIYSPQPAISAQTPAAALPLPASSPPSSSSSSDFIKPAPQSAPTPVPDVVRPSEYEYNKPGGWISKRLDFEANLMALGRTLPDGSREIFMVENRKLIYFQQGSDMKLVSEASLRNNEKIISVDTMIAPDGNLDIYLTVIRSDELSSQIWQLKNGQLVQITEGLPYFFRAFRLAGGEKKLYAQSMGRDADFYGDIFEAARDGSKIVLKKSIKMPRFGNIYSFNQFRDRDNRLYSVVINKENYLIVYDENQKELWRSNDKFGGSELYFQKEDLDAVRVTGDKNRWIFLDQRIQVTSKNEVIVGKNEGFWVLGNARNYKKGAVYCLAWNGSGLEEKWHTRDTQNYMPDFFFDESKNELLILQTVQRGDITTRGASSLSIKKLE